MQKNLRELNESCQKIQPEKFKSFKKLINNTGAKNFSDEKVIFKELHEKADKKVQYSILMGQPSESLIITVPLYKMSGNIGPKDFVVGQDIFQEAKKTSSQRTSNTIDFDKVLFFKINDQITGIFDSRTKKFIETNAHIYNDENYDENDYEYNSNNTVLEPVFDN